MWDEVGTRTPDSSQTADKLQNVSLGSAARPSPFLGLGSTANHWETPAPELQLCTGLPAGPRASVPRSWR